MGRGNLTIFGVEQPSRKETLVSKRVLQINTPAELTRCSERQLSRWKRQGARVWKDGELEILQNFIAARPRWETFITASSDSKRTEMKSEQ